VDFAKKTVEQLKEDLDDLEANPKRNPPELQKQYIDEIKEEIEKRNRKAKDKQGEKEEILY
jgi:phage terminase Nu1 subunit (DNA packaging protein)